MGVSTDRSIDAVICLIGIPIAHEFSAFKQSLFSLSVRLKTLNRAGYSSLLNARLKKKSNCIKYRKLMCEGYILKIGAAYLPLDLNYPQDRLAYMVLDSQIKFIIVKKEKKRDLVTNTLPLRVSFKANQSFSELLMTVQKTLIELYKHQSIPFKKMVELTKNEPLEKWSPLFQVMFAYEHEPAHTLSLQEQMITEIKTVYLT